MDWELPDNVRLFQDVARKFAKDYIAPHAREWDADAGFPDELITKLGEIGLLGVYIPEQYGGAGAGLLAMSVIMEEIARHCGATALLLAAHNGLAVSHILLAANDDQKAKYLPSLASGEYLGAWALTEPGSGSDAAALKTVAKLEGDEWIINGSKQFITNASRAGVIVVLARTDGDGGTDGISAFLVERGTPGLNIGKKEDKLGMRGSDTVPLQFDNMRIPKKNLCGHRGQGFHDTLKILARGRIAISALSLGLARGALEEALSYASEREQFGKPLARHQAIQFMLADMATDVTAARLMIRQGAATYDAGGMDRISSSITKLFVAKMATVNCMKAIQILGGSGYLKDYPVERYMRDAKLCEIGEGTNEVQRMVIARELCKFPERAVDI
jgi:hypothetical protein